MENEIKPEVEKLNSTEEIQAKVQHEVAPKTVENQKSFKHAFRSDQIWGKCQISSQFVPIKWGMDEKAS